MAEHRLDATRPQPFWDNSVTPRLTIDPGDTVVIECLEALGQATPEWSHDDFAATDLDKVHALTGSIAVAGAEPGDVLEIEILSMDHEGWGWTGHIPGFGLLAEEFDYAYIKHWEISAGNCRLSGTGVTVPFDPFPGVVGVAPAEPGRLDTIPPRANAGNVDIRDLGVGSTIWIPVLAPGALFSIGDCHASQGDGEVCGTGIESPMVVSARFDVRRDLALSELQSRRPQPRQPIAGEWHMTTAHGPDLMDNAMRATRYMIDWIEAEQGLSRSDAYIVCSVAADLRISEIVDAPNWIVSMHLPLAIFDQ